MSLKVADTQQIPSDTPNFQLAAHHKITGQFRNRG
jgi:hypothetical protein